jgi:hypothetical protein
MNPNDKDPDILLNVTFNELPIVGFDPEQIRKFFYFKFPEEERKAILANAQTSCELDENGIPRQMTIVLDFEPTNKE